MYVDVGRAEDSDELPLTTEQTGLGANLPSCRPYGESRCWLLLHGADSVFNESECSAQRQENNPEELGGTARLALSVCA